jgi:formate hydrogenlyase subunit 6/NADH:ubiquinone oxidoreductase subunit I
MWFKAYHEFGHGKSVDVSNYLARFNPETCSGCELCVKRCPMEAVTLKASDKANNKKGEIAMLDAGSCIGCGVCAYKCPTESIILEQRGETTGPPADFEEYAERFLMDLSDPLPRRKV